MPASEAKLPVTRTGVVEDSLTSGDSVSLRPTVEELYRRHAVMVARWAARLGGPALPHEDVVQEVFLTVQRELPKFRGEAKVTTWLYRITRHAVQHRRRKDRFRRWLKGLAVEVAGDLPSAEPQPGALLEQREQVDRLYAVLDQLNDRYREVLVLFELEKRTGEEIAALMGARVETVWVWLHRARAQFAKRFAQLEAEEER